MEQVPQPVPRAKLAKATAVFLVGKIEPTMYWYQRLGFEAEYFPIAGLAILRRDDIEIFLQNYPGYVAPEDAGRKNRHAWDVYIYTDNVKALFAEYSALSGVRIPRELAYQPYGMLEFDVIDLNGHRLVFAQPIPFSMWSAECLSSS